VIIDAIVLESYPKIETRIVLDYTTYLKSNKLPPANATYSVDKDAPKQDAPKVNSFESEVDDLPF
jgi:hypothetical protein